MTLPGGLLLRSPDHRYALADADGRTLAGWFPGVTGVLATIARPALMGWVRSETARVAVRELDGLHSLIETGGADEATRWLAGSTQRLSAAAAERGGGVHAIVERLAHDEDPGTIDETAAPFVAAWRSWRDTYGPRFVALEAPVISTGGEYGGTADAFLLDPAGVTWVVDYKTRGNAAATAVYDTEPLQLAALASAELVAASVGGEAVPLPPVDRGAVLLLRPDGSYRFVPVDVGPAQRQAFAEVRALAGYLATADSAIGLAHDSRPEGRL
jgi:hypothetical protein